MIRRSLLRNISGKQPSFSHYPRKLSSFAYKSTFADTMSSQKIPTSLIPKGWTADSVYLAEASESFPASSYGIKDSFTAIVADPGACPTVLVESSKGVFYLWNELSDNVWLVKEPKKLEEIAPKLGDPGLKGVELEELTTLEEVAGIAPAVTT